MSEPEPVTMPRDRKILLLGLDGVRWDLVVDGGNAPTLTAMAEQGRWRPMTMVPPTWSGPGWASILTGSTHEQHGVGDNSFVGHRLFDRPDLLARAFHQDTTTLTFAAAGWPPLVTPGGLGPVVHERAEQVKAGRHRVVARDGEVHGYTAVDREIVDLSLAALRHETAPDVSFVYLCGIDEAGHVHGAVSPQYQAAIARTDAYVGALTRVVAGRAERDGEDWLVVVVTDHGHVDAGGHGGGSDDERAAFVLCWSPEGTSTALPAWPEEIEPHRLMDLLLRERRPADR